MGYCEDGNEILLSVKSRKFIYQLSDYQLLKKDFAECVYVDVSTRWNDNN